MSTIRLGFVGVGGMGQCAHLRNHVIAKDVEIAAIAELRPKLRAAVAERYGVKKAYADHREMLAAEKLDGIVAIQPFGLHGQLIPELLAAGVPVLTEKPLASSIEAGERILAAVKRNGRLFVAYHKRSDPATVAAKRTIDAWRASGELGKLRHLRVVMPNGDWMAGGFSHHIDTKEPFPQVSWDPAPAGMDQPTNKAYQSFVNFYIHQVNLIRHLLGEGWQATHAEPSGALLIGRSASGVPVTIEMATWRTSIEWKEEAFAAFEKGWVRLELPAPMAIDRPGKVTFFRDPGEGAEPTTTSPTLPLVHAMRAQAQNFARAIRGEATPLCGPEDALDDLRVAKRYIELKAAADAGGAKAATGAA